MINTYPRPQLIEIAILLYCILKSLEIVNAWTSAPYEYNSGLVFLIWSLPFLLFYLIPSQFQSKTRLSVPWLACAIAISFLGTLASFNTFHYIGLSIAIGALLPHSAIKILWALCAFVWMPAFGWFGSYYLGEYVLIIRIGIATLAATGMISAILKT